MNKLKTYLVGGAVRDGLLGLPVKDRDYVVVGSTAEALISQGFEQVGQGFPVFLHPSTREEYALARREKKVGVGYTGFEFETDIEVSLEQDLGRRDLTINSMAIADDGSLVDPFGGFADLKARVLRHTSAAFSEDPLRVVRLSRFYARYHHLGFVVATETLDLCSEMVYRGDLDELSDERFWAELQKALSDPAPELFFVMLFEIGALNRVHFFKKLFGGNIDGLMLMNLMKVSKAVLKVREELRADMFAALVAPRDASELFITARAANLFNALWNLQEVLSIPPTAHEVYSVLARARAWGMGTVADDLVQALTVHDDADCDSFNIGHRKLQEALVAGRSVTSGAYKHLDGPDIGTAMNSERVQRISEVLS